MVHSWKGKNTEFFHTAKVLFVKYGEDCSKFSSSGFEDIPELYSNLEEADTRMMLQIKNASGSFQNIVTPTFL